MFCVISLKCPFNSITHLSHTFLWKEYCCSKIPVSSLRWGKLNWHTDLLNITYITYTTIFFLSWVWNKFLSKIKSRLLISKYSMSFCLISEIKHPRLLIFNDAKRSWILHYRGWIIPILNEKRHGIFVLL